MCLKRCEKMFGKSNVTTCTMPNPFLSNIFEPATNLTFYPSEDEPTIDVKVVHQIGMWYGSGATVMIPAPCRLSDSGTIPDCGLYMQATGGGRMQY